MAHPDRPNFGAQLDKRSSSFPIQKVSLDSVAHLPTTAAIKPDEPIDTGSEEMNFTVAMEHIMKEGEVYPIGGNLRSGGRAATRLDNGYNGGNIDLLLEGSIE
jgi:hypothetical protein